jgi:hypothetical protein
MIAASLLLQGEASAGDLHRPALLTVPSSRSFLHEVWPSSFFCKSSERKQLCSGIHYDRHRALFTALQTREYPSSDQETTQFPSLPD